MRSLFISLLTVSAFAVDHTDGMRIVIKPGQAFLSLLGINILTASTAVTSNGVPVRIQVFGY